MNKGIVKIFVTLAVLGFYTGKANAQGVGGISTVPYYCDFENAVERSQWIFRNGNQPNKWYIDTATNNGGRYSMYISQDGGLKNEYNNSAASYVWAYRQIAIQQGLYNISYDWRAQGYSSAHYMRAYLVLQSQFTGAAGSSTGFQTTGQPNGWIPINSTYPTGAIMNNQSTWQNVYIGNVSVPTTGTYYLVFGWVNTSASASGVQPPAAVDNIQITTATCPRPDNLNVRATSATGNASASWLETGNATQWILEYSTSSSFSRSRIINVHSANSIRQGNVITYSALSGFQPYTAYYFRVRAVCDTNTGSGDTSMTSIVCNFRFCPSTVGCIDFTNLTGPDVLCTYGTSNNYGSWSPTNQNNTGPYHNQGIRNPGAGHGNGNNAGASHTICTDLFEKDSLTNYQLSTIPPGECASVMLGCRYGTYLCQATAYSFHVDTTVADIALVNYAVVLVNPGHGANQSPRFIFEILDTNNNVIDPSCGYSNIDATQAAQTWNRGISFGSYPVYWKDWTPVGLDLSPYHGQTIVIRITVFACGAGANNHSGYMYYTLGCTKARITSTTCGGGSQSTSLTAPSGFNYRWYTGQNPNQTISTAQTVTVQLDSTMYYCEVSFVDNASCSFTMSTLATLRYPKANFTGTTSTDSCIYRLRLRNLSHITNDPNVDTINIGPCESFFWDFGNGQTSTAENPTVTYSRPGTYTVKLIAKINDDECVDSIVKRFTFRPPLTSHIVAPRRVCYGDTALLRAATHNYVEYRWSTGYTRDSLYVVPDTTTVYTLVARDSIGCIDSMRVTVGVTDCHIYDTTCRNERYVGYGFNIPASTLRNFADTTVVFERHVRSYFGVDSVTTLHLMIWDTNEAMTYDTFCYGDPYVFYDIPLTRGGVYSKRFTNQHGCDSIIYLDLHELPRPTLELFHSYVPCFYYPITLIARKTGDWIRWSSSPIDTSMSGYETQDTLVVKPHERTIYTAVTGLNGYECTTTASTIVNIENELKAYIHTSSDVANYDQMQVVFYDRSIGNTDRKWFLRDFNRPVGTGENYIYTFDPREDSVNIILVAYIEGTRCYDTTSVTIPLFKDGIWVPSAFTPDESENNGFIIQGIEVSEYEINIYNRNGYRVFTSNDINESWNGGLNNDRSKPCNQGNYSYRVVYKSVSQPDRTFTKVGSVLLLR